MFQNSLNFSRTTCFILRKQKLSQLINQVAICTAVFGFNTKLCIQVRKQENPAVRGTINEDNPKKNFLIEEGILFSLIQDMGLV